MSQSSVNIGKRSQRARKPSIRLEIVSPAQKDKSDAQLVNGICIDARIKVKYRVEGKNLNGEKIWEPKWYTGTVTEVIANRVW